MRDIACKRRWLNWKTFLISLPVLNLATVAFAQTDTTPTVPPVWWIAPIGAIIALGFAYHFYRAVMKQNEGNETMRDIAQSVREGAMAYLRQQYKVVGIVFAVLCLIFIFMAFVLDAQNRVIPFAFLTGGFFSGLCGFLGMKTATNASARTTSAAMEGLNAGLKVSFRAGAVMGLIVVGFALLDITGWFLILYYLFPKDITRIFRSKSTTTDYCNYAQFWHGCLNTGTLRSCWWRYLYQSSGCRRGSGWES